MAAAPRIFVVNSGPTLRLSPELALEIGLDESIFLLQADSLLANYGETGPDGRQWPELSVRPLQRLCFPFWSIATVSRVRSTLLEQGYLVTDAESNLFTLGD